MTDSIKWEIVLTSAGFTASGNPRTTFTITQCVPEAEPKVATHIVSNKTPIDASYEVFEELFPDVERPFVIDRKHAGYWVSVYEVSKLVEATDPSATYSFDDLRAAGKIGADTYPGVLMPLGWEAYRDCLMSAREWLRANLEDYAAEAPYRVWNRLNANYPGGVEAFVAMYLAGDE